MGGGLVAAAGELVAEEFGKSVIGELRLLQADHIRLALIQPWKQPRGALLDRVHVPGRDPHDTKVAPRQRAHVAAAAESCQYVRREMPAGLIKRRWGGGGTSLGTLGVFRDRRLRVAARQRGETPSERQ